MIVKTKVALISAMLSVVGVSSVLAQSGDTPAPKAEPTREIIVAVVSGNVRNAPGTGGAILFASTIGTKFEAVSEKNGWDEVKLNADEVGAKPKTGWVSKTITEPYNSADPGVQFQKIAEKYFSRKTMTFQTARELIEYLPRAADDAKTYEVGGDLRLKKLTALSLGLKAIPPGKSNVSPYKEFLAKYQNDVVYSEPAGEWYVKGERFWELHARYSKYKIGELIAWTAAGNPLPGECEGYINCYLYLLRSTEGEYLNFYPNGKYAKQSLQNMGGMLQPIVSDVRTKTVYYTTSDISDRAEFNRMLAELRKIVSNTPFVEKQDVLKQIDQIAEGFR